MCAVAVMVAPKEAIGSKRDNGAVKVGNTKLMVLWGWWGTRPTN